MPTVRYAQPTYPNAGVEAWYRDQLQALVKAMAQDLLDGVRRAWRDGDGLVPLATDTRKLTTPVLLQRALDKSAARWGVRFNKASMSLALSFATKNRLATEKAMQASFAKAGFTVKFKSTPLIRQAFDASVAENVGLIRSIPEKFHTDVGVAIWQNVAAGSNLTTLTNQLQDKYGISHRRAAFIAKDQNHKVKAATDRARRLDVGITKSKWKHSHAGVTPRPTHVAMDGELYDIAEGMYDSAVEKYIWPGTEPNCRCTDFPVIPGFS
jgi:uncharacterized protein with gpF-like domain